MPSPSQASLRAVGLQWYQEDTIPDKCYMPPISSLVGPKSHPLWDRDCVQAITGKTEGKFTTEDWSNVLTWYGKRVEDGTAPLADFAAVRETSQRAQALVGTSYAEYPTTGVSYDAGAIPREGGALAGDVASKAADYVVAPVLQGLGLEAAVPVGVLVLGLGLVGFGVFRLIR